MTLDLLAVLVLVTLAWDVVRVALAYPAPARGLDLLLVFFVGLALAITALAT